MQKPVQAPTSAMHISNSEGTTEADIEADYGEEYDDTRTFTVKDFKEQALRYAKDHFSHTGPNHTTIVSNGNNFGSSTSDVNMSNSNYGNPFNKAAH
jgi:hypothetical protein